MLRMNFDPATGTASSVLDVNQSIFNIYPNPTDGVFSIELTASEKYDVIVYNVLGQDVFSTVTNTIMTTLDLSSFDKGVYTVELKDNNTSYIEKIIVE